MKRLFVFAVLVVLAATPAILAQETTTVAFGWDSHIVQRVGTTVTPQGQFRVDTNRFDMTVPLLIPSGTVGEPDLIVRGVGQVFAPRHFWRFYDPYYNGDSASASARDQEYVDQFKGVQNWVLDSVRISVFHNSDNVNPASPGQIDFWRLNTDYREPRNSDQGLAFSRQALMPNLIQEAEVILDDNALLNTVTQNGAIVPTSVTFDPPLEFTKEQSVMIMYINDFATPVAQPFQEGDTREWQRLIGYVEFQGGDGSDTKPFSNPIPNNMVHGMIMRSMAGMDTITNSYRAIQFDDPALPYLANFNIIWFGVAELDETDLPVASSVRYHFGYDATEQGLAEVTPNPVRERASIPFSLMETANVTMDLYTADGRFVETILKDRKYVSGKYTIEMSAENLESGSYLVRMTANEKPYSMKFVVTK